MNEIKCSSLAPDKRIKFIKKNIVYVDEGVMSAGYDDLCIPARIKMPSELEYIFQLISCHFSYVKIEEIIMPDSLGHQEPKLAVKILHIPCENTELDISNWNNFAESIKTDFYVRYNLNEWNIDYDALRDKVQECWTDFKIVDRNKLDIDKLTNLILFVFDYCKLTLTKAKLHPQLYDYIEKTIKFGKETYSTSKRIADSIMEYLAEPYIYISRYGVHLLKDTLPEKSYPIYEQNPYAGNKSSYLAMMFIDNMHSFFSSFGIKRIKNSEWSNNSSLIFPDPKRLWQ